LKADAIISLPLVAVYPALLDIWSLNVVDNGLMLLLGVNALVEVSENMIIPTAYANLDEDD